MLCRHASSKRHTAPGCSSQRDVGNARQPTMHAHNVVLFETAARPHVGRRAVMSGLQQAIQFRSQIPIYLESMKFFSATRAGTVVANLLVRKAMVAGHILEADEQCR
jgi:hypothetical protein